MYLHHISFDEHELTHERSRNKTMGRVLEPLGVFSELGVCLFHQLLVEVMGNKISFAHQV